MAVLIESADKGSRLRMSYINGAEPGQHVLFPSTLDEYVAEDNPVRAMAAFIGVLDVAELGFVRGKAAATGRPGYDPRQLLGLYIWGHLNKVRTSRKLERECGRNLEAMWMMRNLRPDFKTLADFRKDNGEAIKQVVVQFRCWCLSEDLYGKEVVAIDGSKFKAQNNSERNFTAGKLEEIIKREERKIEKYLQELDEADAAEAAEEEEQPRVSAVELQEKVKRLKEKLAGQKKLQEQMAAEQLSQISLTDADARLMKTSKGSAVSYNVQTVVDSKYKLIAAYEVTNEGNDLGQLVKMAQQSKAALGVEELTVLTDGGYYEGAQLKECEVAGVTTYLPLPQSGAASSRGVFPASAFNYDPVSDVYVCPQGEELTFRGREKGSNQKEYRLYRTKACATCALRAKCTKARRGRKIRRWVHEDVLERLKERIQRQPQLLKERKKLAEHPFGTIKLTMDQGYFLLKGLKKVTTEFSLTVLSYNFKRVLSIFGVERMISSWQRVPA
jgi:transposase